MNGADAVSAENVESIDQTNSIHHSDANITYIEIINEDLAGSVHPETGVPFERNEIVLTNGDVVEGVFPIFQSAYDVVIPETDYFESDHVHFHYANEQLYSDILMNPNVAQKLNFSTEDIQALSNSETPEGFTWHHHEEPGVLQPVDEETHNQTAHNGGRFVWGGGSENR